MTPERWRQITEVFHAALARDAAARDGYLEDACRDDPALRAEVGQLLAGHANAGSSFGTVSAGGLPEPSRRLEPGTTLGPYRIEALLGAGGMGEVYRARDTRLGREVAVKVLPELFRGDAERRRRFEREARAISSLAHPHICALYDVGEHDHLTYLVMELVAGETLSHRLEGGAMPLDEALRCGIEIAGALARAHQHGIIHRDVKPGNVMLTKDGAKLLDFGLAKLRADPTAIGAAGPTPGATSTVDGMILGTLSYMAPEQLQGKETDARSDIFSFGAVLYETLTGRRAFHGESQASLIAATLERDPPPPSSMRPGLPPLLDRLVRQCLAKAPDDRPDTARDVANLLGWIREMSGGGTLTSAGQVPQARRRPAYLAPTLALGGVLIGVAADRWLRPPERPVNAVVHSLLDVAPAEELNAGGVGRPGGMFSVGGSRTAVAWTPDGRALVFVGRRESVQRLYVRDLTSDEARPLPGTEGAQVPVVSSDGRWVAFWADQAIRKTPIAGGPTSVLVPEQSTPPRGMTLDAGGRVYYGAAADRPRFDLDIRGGPRIWRSAPEAKPQEVTVPAAGEFSHSLPHLLPGDKTLLFTVRRRVWTWGDEEVVAQDLSTGQRKTLLRDVVDARYVPGYLVFLRRGVLMAAPFDAEAVALRGQPGPVLENVSQALTSGSSADMTGAGQFAVVAAGTLAYLPAAVQPWLTRTLVSLDRQGRATPLPAAAKSFTPMLALAPDGLRLAVTTRDIRQEALWVVDASRGTLAQLSSDAPANPRFTPDGRRIVYSRIVRGVHELVQQPVDGTAPAQVLARGRYQPSSWSPDGRHLASELDGDIWILTFDSATPTVRRLTETPEIELWPEFSPDGRWLAYGSNATGRTEIYVQAWPEGPRTQVSLWGATSPAWNPRGGEMFYLDATGSPTTGWRVMAVEVQTTPRLRIGTPRVLFEHMVGDLGVGCLPVRCYAVSADGQRFFVTQIQSRPPTPRVTHIRLIHGWLDEIKARLDGETSR